jgi:hypothetical protein
VVRMMDGIWWVCQLQGWMEIGGVPIVRVDVNWWGANCQGG